MKQKQGTGPAVEEGEVDGFVGELTFQNQLMNTLCQISLSIKVQYFHYARKIRQYLIVPRFELRSKE